MAKTIRLSESTHNALDEFRFKRETFDQAVQRLLLVFNRLREVSDRLPHNHPSKATLKEIVAKGV